MCLWYIDTEFVIIEMFVENYKQKSKLGHLINDSTWNATEL